MLRNGSFTRFADWRFMHRARLDCVPLNATKRFGDGPERLRPDIDNRPDPTRTREAYHDIDITVAFENRYEPFARARQGKIAKYQPIIDHFRKEGWAALQEAIVVGSVGSWDPANERALHMPQISRRYARLMRKLIVSDTVRWSRDMYIEHVTGQRQFPTT